MTRPHTSLPHGLLLSFLSAGTAWASVLAWRGLTWDAADGFIVPLFFAGILTAGIGALGRWLRVPLVLVLLLQVVVVGMWVLATVTGSGLPTSTTLDAFTSAWAAGVESAQTYVAPVPSTAPPIHPLLLVGGALALVAVDLLACALQRVSISGLVLLTTYSLPVTLIGDEMPWWAFAVPAAGFLGMLFVQHDQQLSRWGRQVDQDDATADPAGFGVRTGAVRGSALAIGGTATTLAVFLPLLVPTLDLSLLDGPGTGGSGKIEVADPLVDMRRDLSRGRDVPLMWVSTPGRKPEYFRLAVLTRYNGDSWTPGDRDIPDNQIAQGQMPALHGVSTSLEQTETPYNVRVSQEFESEWLPTTQHVSEITAGLSWRYDRRTMDFMSINDELTTAGKTYSLTGVSVDPDPESMDDTVSGASAVDPVFTQVPATLPTPIRSIAEGVTGAQDTRFRKARALQQWFREDGGFTYNLEAVESTGSGFGDLVSFLEQGGREGYCEQFAAAMAIMARTLGIPARVAIGFLEPRAAGPNTWEFSAWDMHAWPELYFPGSGWVRFEPTPSARAGSVPGYTTEQLAPDPEDVTGPTGRAEEPLPERGADGPAAEDSAADDAAGGGFPWWPVAGGLVALLLAGLVLLVPRAVRRSRRDRRWRAGGIEEAWQELRDVATDLGHGWPAGRSPRVLGQWLGLRFGAHRSRAERAERPRRGLDLAPEASAAVDRLVAELERARYARTSLPGDAGERRADVEAVTRALRDGVSPRVESRAEWWPRSVVKRERPVAAERAERQVVTSGSSSGAVDHVG